MARVNDSLVGRGIRAKKDGFMYGYAEYFCKSGKSYIIVSERKDSDTIQFVDDRGINHGWDKSEILDNTCEYFELCSEDDRVVVRKGDTSTKEKSTGGSSSYYKINLEDWIINKQKEQGYIMLEDLAEILFDNDFNFTNVFKAQKRMFELTKGGGKEGNDFQYDATKSKYYVDKQVEVYNRKFGEEK